MSGADTVAATPPALELGPLDAFYGRAQVLDQVALTVPPGAVVALIGRNGAGKSTLVKAAMGLVSAHGPVRVFGTDLSAEPPFRRALAGVGYVPEERRIFADLSVAENLAVGAEAAANGDRPGHFPVERLYEMFPNLAGARRRPGGSLSGGEQQMLAIARTLAGAPRLILLDEPSEGVAPKIVDALTSALASVRGEGVSVLLAEQNRRFSERLAKEVVVLDRGRVAFAGSFSALAASPEIEAAALGV